MANPKRIKEYPKTGWDAMYRWVDIDHEIGLKSTAFFFVDKDRNIVLFHGRVPSFLEPWEGHEFDDLLDSIESGDIDPISFGLAIPALYKSTVYEPKE